MAITGGSSGIGRCTAGLFARHGWRVGLIARGEVGLQAACKDVERYGALVAMAQADVTDPIALEAAATAIEEALGAIDVWVNCAGNGTYGRFLDTPAEEFRRVTDVTYLGTANGTRVALQRMLPRDHGRIVNVCSAVAFHGMPLLSSYSGAKHAIRGFDQSIQAELSQEGSRVFLTTVFPPAVNTPFFDHAVSHMGRMGRPMSPVYQPEIIAEAIHLAAITRRREMSVTFTTVLFSICSRLTPGLVAAQSAGWGFGPVGRPRGVAGAAPPDFIRCLRPGLSGQGRVRLAGTLDERTRQRLAHACQNDRSGGAQAEGRLRAAGGRQLDLTAHGRHYSRPLSRPCRASLRVAASTLPTRTGSSARRFGRAAARSFT